MYSATRYADLSEIILVGHSHGAMVVTGVADRMGERIQHLVDQDAFLPADGQSLYDVRGAEPDTESESRVRPRTHNENASEPEAIWNTAGRAPRPRATRAEKIRMSAPLEIREIDGGHNVQHTSPHGLTSLLLELIPSTETVAV